MQKSWNDRLRDANRDKEEAEDSTIGYYVELLLRKFFISDEIIPERCKIYFRNKVQRYNFTDVDLIDLVVKEVFLRRVKYIAMTDLKIDMSEISFRMEALRLILEHDHSNYKGLPQSIYSHALLAATASLFTALSEQNTFANILTDHLLKAFRKKAFHFHFSFRTRINNSIDLKTLKILVAHIYDHCRLELADFCAFEPLSFPILEEQRFSLDFKNLLVECLDTHAAYFESTKTLLTNLPKDSEQLMQIIALVNDDSHIFCSPSCMVKTREAIVGNAIGLLVANMSASVMSLCKERTFSQQKLTAKQKTEIQDEFGCYVQKGSAFRHNKLSYVSMLVYFNITMRHATIPKKVPKVIASKNNSSQTRRVKNLPIKYHRTTTRHSENIWGIMNNGFLAGLSQNLSCHILDPIRGEIKSDVMLNSATPQYSYFQHAFGSIPNLVLKTRYMVIVAYQYLHFIDMDPTRCEPEKIMRLPDGGGTAIVELDNNYFAVGSGSGQITIHDSETAQVLKILPVDNKLHQGSKWVNKLVQLSNNRLACGYNGGLVFIWNFITCKLEAILHPADDIEVIIRDRKTGHREAKSYPSLDKAIFPPYDENTSVTIGIPKPIPGVWKGGKPQGTASTLLVSNDGNLYVGYGDKSIALWDMKTYKLIKTFVGHDDWPHALMTLPNGQLVSTGADKTVRIWDRNGCKKTLTLSHPGFFAKIVGDKVIVADHNNSTVLDIQELTH